MMLSGLSTLPSASRDVFATARALAIRAVAGDTRARRARAARALRRAKPQLARSRGVRSVLGGVIEQEVLARPLPKRAVLGDDALAALAPHTVDAATRLHLATWARWLAGAGVLDLPAFLATVQRDAARGAYLVASAWQAYVARVLSDVDLPVPDDFGPVYQMLPTAFLITPSERPGLAVEIESLPLAVLRSDLPLDDEFRACAEALMKYVTTRCRYLGIPSGLEAFEYDSPYLFQAAEDAFIVAVQECGKGPLQLTPGAIESFEQQLGGEFDHDALETYFRWRASRRDAKPWSDQRLRDWLTARADTRIGRVLLPLLAAADRLPHGERTATFDDVLEGYVPTPMLLDHASGMADVVMDSVEDQINNVGNALEIILPVPGLELDAWARQVILEYAVVTGALQRVQFLQSSEDDRPGSGDAGDE